MVKENQKDENKKMLIELTRMQNMLKKCIASCGVNKCMDPQSSGTKVATENGNGCKASKDLWLTLSDSEDSTDQILKEIRPPDKFICPLTKQVMSDPVILSSGKTVERTFIEAFFYIYPTCRLCPVTKTEQLPSHKLIPADALRTEIKRWQENKSINNERRDNFRMLLRKLTYPGEDRLASAAELRALVHDFPSYANVFYDMGPSAVVELAIPLLSKEPATPESLREDLIVTFRLLVKHNKKIRRFFMFQRDVVNVIAESLRTGSSETRRSAVILIRYITADRDSRYVLKQLGVIEHLVELVEEGDLLLLYDAVLALFRLKFVSQRVIDGILSAILNSLADENQISNIERLLNMVMKDTVVSKHVVEADIIYNALFNMLMDSKSDTVKAFCVSTLLRFVRSSHSALQATMMYEEEYEVIAQILEEGTPEAKENAIKLLYLLDAEQLDQTSAMEIHQNELESADDLMSPAEVCPNKLESVDVMGTYTPDRMERTGIHHNEHSSNSLDDHIHMGDADIHKNEVESVDAMGTDKTDHMEGTELHHNELLDLLQETECGDVMQIWAEVLLRQVERNEAALIATWKREKNFKAITRIQVLGNVKAWKVAEEIFRWLETVHPDQIHPGS